MHSLCVVQAAPSARFSHRRVVVLQMGLVAGQSGLVQQDASGMQTLPHILWVAGLHEYEQVLAAVQVPMVPVPPVVHSVLAQQPVVRTHNDVTGQFL